MKFRNFILFTVVLVGFSGCYIGEPSYEVFVKNMEANLRPPSPILSHKNKQIYSKDRYIYIVEWNKEGCVVGFLSNKDDKPERVLGWTILSGKEFCKERRAWALSF